MYSDFIDRLFATLELDREISDEIIAIIEHQESISIPRDINRWDYFSHMTERPAIDGPELKRFERQICRPIALLST